MRIARVWLLGLAVLMLPALASAASLQKGSSLLAIQLSRGVADANTDNGGALLSSTWPEVGLQGQYWYFLANEYAVTGDAGIGYYKESVTADPNSLFATDQTVTLSSWHGRLGGDRFGKITDKLQVFAGPGIQIWSGKLKFKDPSGEAEQPSTTRFALSGRIGALIQMGENFGIMGHIGQYWGYATASDGGAKTKWLPSGSEGAMGFSFGF